MVTMMTMTVTRANCTRIVGLAVAAALALLASATAAVSPGAAQEIPAGYLSSVFVDSITIGAHVDAQGDKISDIPPIANFPAITAASGISGHLPQEMFTGAVPEVTGIRLVEDPASLPVQRGRAGWYYLDMDYQLPFGNADSAERADLVRSNYAGGTGQNNDAELPDTLIMAQVRLEGDRILATSAIWKKTSANSQTRGQVSWKGIELPDGYSGPIAIDFFNVRAEAKRYAAGGAGAILCTGGFSAARRAGEGTYSSRGTLDGCAVLHLDNDLATNPGAWFGPIEIRNDQTFNGVHLTWTDNSQGRNPTYPAPAGLWKIALSSWGDYAFNVLDDSGQEIVRMPGGVATYSRNPPCNQADGDQLSLCLPFPAGTDIADARLAQAEWVVVVIEDVRLRNLVARTPGGAIAGQLILTMLGGIAVAATGGRRMRSPAREMAIAVGLCAGSTILPVIGMGTLFWTGAVCLLCVVGVIASYWLTSRA